MTVFQNQSVIEVQDPVARWEGRGTIEGSNGHYTWRIANGVTGQTNFTVMADGSLQGISVGRGMTYSFVARPSGSTQAPATASTNQTEDRYQAAQRCAAETRQLASIGRLSREELNQRNAQCRLAAGEKHLAAYYADAAAAKKATPVGLLDSLRQEMQAGDTALEEGKERQALPHYQAVVARSGEIRAAIQTIKDAVTDKKTAMYWSMFSRILIRAEGQIGICYDHLGDYAEAAESYQRTIDAVNSFDPSHPASPMQMSGMTQAVTRLGFLYAKGRGVPKDESKAYELFGGRNNAFINLPSLDADNPFIYLTQVHKLPDKYEDTKKQLDKVIADKQKEDAYLNMLILLALFTPGSAGHSHAVQGPNRYQCNRMNNAGNGVLAGMSGCSPW